MDYSIDFKGLRNSTGFLVFIESQPLVASLSVLMLTEDQKFQIKLHASESFDPNDPQNVPVDLEWTSFSSLLFKAENQSSYIFDKGDFQLGETHTVTVWTHRNALKSKSSSQKFVPLITSYGFSMNLNIDRAVLNNGDITTANLLCVLRSTRRPNSFGQLTRQKTRPWSSQEKKPNLFLSLLTRHLLTSQDMSKE